MLLSDFKNTEWYGNEKKKVFDTINQVQFQLFFNGKTCSSLYIYILSLPIPVHTNFLADEITDKYQEPL